MSAEVAKVDHLFARYRYHPLLAVQIPKYSVHPKSSHHSLHDRIESTRSFPSPSVAECDSSPAGGIATRLELHWVRRLILPVS